MPEVIYTADLKPHDLDPVTRRRVYNGLDCCVTREVFNKVTQDEVLDEGTWNIYNFSKKMQGPALQIMLRGKLVDEDERQRLIEVLSARQARLETNLNKLAYAVWDKGLNARSPKQMRELLYDTYKVEPIYAPGPKKKDRQPTTDREALETIRDVHFYTRPIINFVFAIRDNTKRLSLLRSGVDNDGRMRTSANITGTETGRWSMSKNVLGTGTNDQNITDELRRIFIADPGYKLGYADLATAESRVVAYRSGDKAYIAANESGDLHTAVAQLVWPDLAWTGDLKTDRALAEQKCYRHFSYRDLAKRGGHACNYGATPWTIARNLKIALDVATVFHAAYFKAFPGLKRWHQRVATQLQTKGKITTALGRSRIFFGRLNDDATVREAIAYEPQSVVADVLNQGLYYVWHYLEQAGLQILTQVHDAILFQFPTTGPVTQAEWIKGVCDIMTLPFEIDGQTLTIPVDCSIGWNWQKYSAKCEVCKAQDRTSCRCTVYLPVNPEGLLDAGKKRTKARRPRRDRSYPAILDRRVSGLLGGP